MNMGMKGIGVRRLALALSGICVFIAIGAVPVYAANISFTFSGTVSDVHGGVFTSGGTGTNGFGSALPLSGAFSFNPATSDVLPGDPTWGLYPNAIQNMTVQVGNYTATFAPPPGSSVMQVVNNGLGNTFKVTLNGLTGNPVNGLSPAIFEIELINPSGSAFANDHLPTTPPVSHHFPRINGVWCSVEWETECRER